MQQPQKPEQQNPTTQSLVQSQPQQQQHPLTWLKNITRHPESLTSRLLRDGRTTTATVSANVCVDDEIRDVTTLEQFDRLLKIKTTYGNTGSGGIVLKQDAIQQLYLKKLRQAERGWRPAGKFYLSEVMDTKACLKKAGYARRGIYPTNPDPINKKNILAATVGELAATEVQVWLVENGLVDDAMCYTDNYTCRPGISGIEVPLNTETLTFEKLNEFKSYGVGGRADAILSAASLEDIISEEMGLLLQSQYSRQVEHQGFSHYSIAWECKALSAEKFKGSYYKSDLEKFSNQLQAYLHFFKLPYGVVFVINRGADDWFSLDSDGQEIWSDETERVITEFDEWLVRYDPNFVVSRLQAISQANDDIFEERLPKASPSKLCGWCGWRSDCADSKGWW